MTPASSVILYLAASLDGFIAAPDGSVGRLEPFSADDDYGYAGFRANIGAIIMGSRTYEQVLGLGDWPYPGLPCFVLASRALPAPDDADVRFRPGADLEAVAAEARTAANNRAVWLVGGAAIARSMLDTGLVDTLEITLMPVLLGAAISLYDPGMRPSAPALCESRTFSNGVAQLRYSVDRA